VGMGFITTWLCVRPPTLSSRSIERFFPQRPTPWTIAAVRRHLQALLLGHLPHCPLCRQPTGGNHPPRGRLACDQVLLNAQPCAGAGDAPIPSSRTGPDHLDGLIQLSRSGTVKVGVSGHALPLSPFLPL
jgi:hypothetical protein